MACCCCGYGCDFDCWLCWLCWCFWCCFVCDWFRFCFAVVSLYVILSFTFVFCIDSFGWFVLICVFWIVVFLDFCVWGCIVLVLLFGVVCLFVFVVCGGWCGIFVCTFGLMFDNSVAIILCYTVVCDCVSIYCFFIYWLLFSWFTVDLPAVYLRLLLVRLLLVVVDVGLFWWFVYLVWLRFEV